MARYAQVGGQYYTLRSGDEDTQDKWHLVHLDKEGVRALTGFQEMYFVKVSMQAEFAHVLGRLINHYYSESSGAMNMLAHKIRNYGVPSR